MAYAPTLSTFLDANPCPRVEVLFSELPYGVATVTVFRLAGGREFKLRGAVRAPVAGAFVRLDYEVPFGVDATYRAEMFDPDGTSLGFTSTASITVNETGTWVHNPLNPSGAVRVAFRGNAARDLSRPVEGDVFYPMGRRVGVVVAGQRRGLSGVQLDVVTDTLEQADKVADLLGSYSYTTVPTLCFRVGAFDRVRLPRPLFAAVLDVREQDMTYEIGGSTIAFEMQGDEVAPPATGLFISLLTRADVNAYYSSRLALNNDNLTRLGVNRRYDLASGIAPLPEVSYEYPVGSGLYTSGPAMEAPESGMFLTDGYTEDPAGSRLYKVPGVA
jgi:hypothetical protein